MSKKNKDQSGDLRLKLLKAASEIISKNGMKKLTMRALSTQVGVSRTAPYRHFKNKNALLLAVAKKGFNELTSHYQKINKDKSIDSLARLQNIGLAYIEFAIINPGIFRLMFGQEIAQQKRSDKLNSAAKQTFNEYLVAVKTFLDENSIAAGNYSILANYSWATVHGLAVLLIDGQVQVVGQNYGLPTLLTDDSMITLDNISSMMAFSKQTLMDFWDLILKGK
ncbi:MAG: TetR/AcrR family transcriptional regulator [Desulfobacteraceae bacterium]|nr:TetR/AcrR family transcriptional regulator [Desulfobacteraceae bacterium]